MKSQVNDVLPVLLAICEDVRVAYPAIDGIDRDIQRLSRLCQTRGLGFLCLDLPSLDKVLLDGLEEGHLPASFGPFRAVSKKCHVPRLFSGLWLRVFDKNAMLKPDVDFTAIAFLRQLSTVAKKLEMGCSPRRCFAALEKYYEVESSLPTPSLNWEGNWGDPESLREGLHIREVLVKDAPLLGPPSFDRGRANLLLSKVQQVADLILSSMLPYDPHLWSDVLMEYEGVSGFKHGPGAVQERLQQWEKSTFKEWSWKLESIFPFYSFGIMMNDNRVPIRKERPSRLLMVPKTLKSPRIICAEPVAQQWCQQAILGFMEFEFDRLWAGDFIDLKDQGKSGSMVLSASRDQKHSTIDLSDASDRLSCFVVERLFRRNPALLDALYAARTRYVDVEYRRHKNFIRLKKFASQGTAVTFPVQSLCFLIMALAASHRGSEVSLESLQRLRKDVRVYGDDIIVPTHGYVDLKSIMSWCFLKVNDDKSFSKGKFRESCGTDAYSGYDITPCKPTVFGSDAPGDIIAIVDTSNNLFKKGFWHASNELLSHLPQHVLCKVRYTGPDTPGIFGAYSYSGSDERHLRTRWNNRLHRYEVRTFVISAKVQTVPRDGYGVLVDFSTRRYSSMGPRVSGEYRRIRYTKGRVQWEPAVNSSHLSPLPMGGIPSHL